MVKGTDGMGCAILSVSFHTLFCGEKAMEKSLTEEMTPDEINGLRELIDEILAEIKLKLERIRQINERIDRKRAEREQLKREIRIISARTDEFLNTHFRR
jgi:uncharacterized membrane protein YheB (UPF0754 family)